MSVVKDAGKDQNLLPLHLFEMKHSVLWKVNTADKKSVKIPASVFGCKEIIKNTSTSAQGTLRHPWTIQVE